MSREYYFFFTCVNFKILYPSKLKIKKKKQASRVGGNPQLRPTRGGAAEWGVLIRAGLKVKDFKTGKYLKALGAPSSPGAGALLIFGWGQPPLRGLINFFFFFKFFVQLGLWSTTMLQDIYHFKLMCYNTTNPIIYITT